MNAYLITFHETDGNDCTVYDAVVEASTESDALAQLTSSVQAVLDSNGTSYEEDGSEFGCYFNCSEDCSELCEGHGGMALRHIETYPTVAEAELHRARYHSRWTV